MPLTQLCYAMLIIHLVSLECPQKCCHNFIKINFAVPLSLISISLCVCFPSSLKESFTTVWVLTWRTSLTSPTVWLPTIAGFTTNTTLTTLDRYKRKKCFEWLFMELQGGLLTFTQWGQFWCSPTIFTKTQKGLRLISHMRVKMKRCPNVTKQKNKSASPFNNY